MLLISSGLGYCDSKRFIIMGRSLIVVVVIMTVIVVVRSIIVIDSAQYFARQC